MKSTVKQDGSAGEPWVWEAAASLSDTHTPDTQAPDEDIRELPVSFAGRGEVKGYYFTQVRGTARGYIYRVEGCPVPSENRGRPLKDAEAPRPDTRDTPSTDIHYEVFKRVVNSQFGCVSYPRAKSFGLWAWTGESLMDAEGLFEKFVNKNSI